MRLRRPKLPAVPKPNTRALRDPRLLLLCVPVIALLLLMSSTHGARAIPIAANAPTTTVAPGSDESGEAGKFGAPAYDADSGDGSGGLAAGADGSTGADSSSDGYGSSSGGSSSRSTGSGSARRSSGSGSSSAGRSPSASVLSATEVKSPGAATPTTAAVGATPTTTIPNPQAVVSEAGSPAVLGIVGIGVAVLVTNGLVLMRRRRNSQLPKSGNQP